MKKITLQLLILFLVSTAFSQTALITNVDTTYLSPKWLSATLSVTEYRNGKDIYKCESEYEFAKTNKPAYIIKQVNGIDQTYYNQRVLLLSDGDTLAPYGFKIPNINDYLNFNNFRKIENKSFVLSELLNLNKYSLPIKFNGYLDESFYLDTTEQFFWTPNFTKGSESGTAIKFDLNSTKKTIQFSNQEMYRGYGLSLHCLENLDEIIQDSIFDYNKLLPNDYKELLLSLFSEVKKAESTSKEFIYKIKGELNCDKDGNVSGYFNSEEIVFGKMKVDGIIPKMNQIIKEFNTVPYYHGNILKARSDLSLVFKLERIDLEKETFYLSFSKTQKLKGNYELKYASEYSFRIKQYDEKVKIEDGGNVAILQSTIYISSFRSKGPIYAIGSILPGLGMSLITYGNSNSKIRTNFKKFLLISSITAGTAAVVSKLYSNQYYNRYLNYLNSESSAENYKKANALQKVFLSAGIGYCLLGAIDFTWTFVIGCKNKSIQNKLNKQIKGSPTNFILQ
jgi:hypothetical protein